MKNYLKSLLIAFAIMLCALTVSSQNYISSSQWATYRIAAHSYKVTLNQYLEFLTNGVQNTYTLTPTIVNNFRDSNLKYGVTLDQYILAQIASSVGSGSSGVTSTFAPYGMVYQNDFNSSHWTSSGPATFSFTGSAINISGGNTTSLSQLTYNNFCTASANYAMCAKYIVNSSVVGYPSGLGVGVSSVNSSSKSAYAFYSNNGTLIDIADMYLMTPATGTNTIIGTSGAGLVPYSAGDTLRSCLERVGDRYTFYLRNVTTNTASTSFSYSCNPYQFPLLQTTGELNNRSRPSLFAYAGSYKVVGMSFFNYSLVGANCAIVGDSKFQGYYQGNYINTISNTLSFNKDNVVNLTGASDASAQAVQCTTEVANLAPVNILIQIGCNDARASVPIATYTANLSAMATSAQAAGSKVYFLLSCPEDNLNVVPYNAAMVALGAAMGITVIDTYTPLLDTDGKTLAPWADAGDRFHLSALAIIVIKRAVRQVLPNAFN